MRDSDHEVATALPVVIPVNMSYICVHVPVDVRQLSPSVMKCFTGGGMVRACCPHAYYWLHGIYIICISIYHGIPGI